MENGGKTVYLLQSANTYVTFMQEIMTICQDFYRNLERNTETDKQTKFERLISN